MKTSIVRLALMLALITGFTSVTSYAQTTRREASKALKKRADRDARKEARKFEREGYSNFPGQLPLDKQLNRYYQNLLMEDENMVPLYINATGVAVAATEDVAIANSLNNATLNMAAQISSSVANLIENNKANSQMSTEEAESISEFISNAKTLIQNEMGTIQPTVAMRKPLPDKRVEVRYEVLYSLENAKLMARKLIKKELKDKIEENEEELNKILGI